MSFEVLTTDEFLKDTKAIIKVYPGFKHDIQKTISLLEENPEHKLRISISGKSSGKSFGARLISFGYFRSKQNLSPQCLCMSRKKDLSKEETKIIVSRAATLQSQLLK